MVEYKELEVCARLGSYSDRCTKPRQAPPPSPRRKSSGQLLQLKSDYITERITANK